MIRMKRTFWTLAAMAGAVIGTAGCNNGTPGGPGADTGKDKDKEKPSALQQAEDAVIQHEGTYSLTMPLLTTRIKQSEDKVVSVGIRRGKNFDEDVTVKFEGAPTGVTVDPETATIKHGEKETKVNIKASNDAAVGEFSIKVTGHAEKGTDASNNLKIIVEKK
jgi:uncharacterized membrane protein